MTTTARRERQARLVARKLERGEQRTLVWLPAETFDRLRQAYPTELHKAPDWKRIAEAALKMVDHKPSENNP